MGIQLRIVKTPARLVFIPQPIALRYLAKDDNGHAHICERSNPHPKPVPADKTAEPPNAPLPRRGW